MKFRVRKLFRIFFRIAMLLEQAAIIVIFGIWQPKSRFSTPTPDIVLAVKAFNWLSTQNLDSKLTHLRVRIFPKFWLKNHRTLKILGILRQKWCQLTLESLCFCLCSELESKTTFQSGVKTTN